MYDKCILVYECDMLNMIDICVINDMFICLINFFKIFKKKWEGGRIKENCFGKF